MNDRWLTAQEAIDTLEIKTGNQINFGGLSNNESKTYRELKNRNLSPEFCEIIILVIKFNFLPSSQKRQLVAEMNSIPCVIEEDKHKDLSELFLGSTGWFDNYPLEEFIERVISNSRKDCPRGNLYFWVLFSAIYQHIISL